MNRVDTRETVQSADQAVIRCESVTKTFREGRLNVPVLRGIDFTVDPGEQIAIIGASGSGRSTLLHILGGLAEPTTGKVIVNGQDIDALGQAEQGTLRNQALGFVYQFHHLLPEFTALENVAMPLLIRRMVPADALASAREILEKTGLADRLEHKPGELSGGERQRAAIARAMVTRPRLMLLDEPFAAVDALTRRRLHALFLGLMARERFTALLVTHDIEEAALLADRILVLEGGRIVQQGTHAELAASAGLYRELVALQSESEAHGATRDDAPAP